MTATELYTLVFIIAALVLFRSVRSFYRPIRGNGGRLLLPLVYMLPATYVLMNPDAHATSNQWLVAAAVGIVLSLPLIWTTRYEMRSDNQIYAKPNVWFVVSFLAVLATRFVLRASIDGIDSQTLSALFVTVAFCYVIPWRVVSYIKFRMVKTNSGVGKGFTL
ncbi:membrane protein CcdC involved in cytochrome C biogenesis [Paenibacillus cellulosilyticus]|uniref:Membrane protein CcdC involved in cytochrome C biogenesis n=1 Tax=Paenibacillus cellulosilyticus TaxID=375489 RepID=A0A2V2YZ85_9BACL|nr:CcdC protein domain-containing protein [Paenibacillus cellulosilyticus]PWV98644.1 membrane protein CcdC involved in cytochrome C biogenesis [Paenibacillus cellulosilyticus]QKS43843.1 cytochrome c biogenesis protein CcdC [Paenibacillus cellulosilyticus]